MALAALGVLLLVPHQVRVSLVLTLVSDQSLHQLAEAEDQPQVLTLLLTQALLPGVPADQEVEERVEERETIRAEREHLDKVTMVEMPLQIALITGQAAAVATLVKAAQVLTPLAEMAALLQVHILFGQQQHLLVSATTTQAVAGVEHTQVAHREAPEVAGLQRVKLMVTP